MHTVHKQIAIKVGIFEGRLKLKAQVLVKLSRISVTRSDDSSYSFTPQLDKRVIETKPEKFSAQPASARDGCYVHLHIGAIEAIVDDACEETPVVIKQANGNSAARNPRTARFLGYPRSDKMVMASNDMLHSIPPGCTTNTVADHLIVTEFVAHCKRRAAA